MLRAMVQASPGDLSAWMQLAACHGMLGDYAECESSCRKVIDIEPRAFAAWGNLGNALKAQGRHAEAEAAYRQALAIEPRYAMGLNNLGNLLRERGNLEEAERCVRAALSIQPEFADALVNLGTVLQSRHKLAESVEHYHRALAAQPDHREALFNLGCALKTLGRPAEAITVLERLVALMPEHVEAWTALGSLHHRIRQVDRAIACCERAVAIKPDHGAAWNTLGHAFQAQKDFDKAEAMYRRALTHNRDLVDARYFLAAIGRETAPGRSPPQYVKDLFDNYAHSFDGHLVGTLKYYIPQLLATAVRQALSSSARDLALLDLGCGTGLGGEALKDIAGRRVGVDLSLAMIEKARERGIYHELIAGDVLEPMRQAHETFDLVIATDVFIYIGELHEVFQATAESLRPGGLFAFSVEAEPQAERYALRPSGRYAHAHGYIERLAQETAFTPLSVETVVLREERGVPMNGEIWVLRKPPAGIGAQ